MGRLSQALPSFLTPPRSKQHLPEAEYASDEESEEDGPNGRGGRYRAPGRNQHGGGEQPVPGTENNRRSSRGGGAPPNSFVMPHERKRPDSFVAPPSERGGQPAHPNANTARRQTWGAPGSKAAEEAPPPTSGRDAKRPAMNPAPNGGSQSNIRSLDDYRSALKDWKQQQNLFMAGYQEQYVPVMQRRFARTQPELEAALSPFCGPQELQICMRHWDQESKRFPTAGVVCANNMKAVGRDAWNELVVLDEQAASGQVFMENLRIKLDDVYKIYLKAVELSKENLWHTLDFNVEESPNMRQEVRETYWGSFERFKVIQREHQCGLPILALPTSEVDPGRRA
ncbi:hypothetical protein PVAG01_03652 [Phlyctema vagabunda]|uniref:Uncharacterized protein n=1 Tax=Phlyctema vagabunda TaxID=108571 RepID=A0ABR4PN58_9HELO